MVYILYAVAWFLFAIVHSLLARPVIQSRIENYLWRFYRLTYNLLAIFSIALVLLTGRLVLNTNRFVLFDNKIALFATFSLQITGFIVLLLALSTYDIGRFTGITQVITNERLNSADNEPLQKLGLNRWVRHPLYTGAFFVLWGGSVSMFDVWTAVWGTLYLLIGTLFEERKLIKIYGDEYKRYQQEVPRYFPAFSPGK